MRTIIIIFYHLNSFKARIKNLKKADKKTDFIAVFKIFLKLFAIIFVALAFIIPSYFYYKYGYNTVKINILSAEFSTTASTSESSSSSLASALEAK